MFCVGASQFSFLMLDEVSVFMVSLVFILFSPPIVVAVLGGGGEGRCCPLPRPARPLPPASYPPCRPPRSSQDLAVGTFRPDSHAQRAGFLVVAVAGGGRRYWDHATGYGPPLHPLLCIL